MHVHELFGLAGRVALVTGGSRGLGKEIAEGLGEAGAKVVISARREQWLTPAAEEFRRAGIDCLAVPCDVTDLRQVRSLVGAAVDRFGGIDILVNSAGISWAAPILEMPLDKWHQVLETNVTAAFLVSQAAGPVMIDRGQGKVVNVASITGLFGEAPEVLDAAGYSAAKGGLIALTRDLAVKWARHNVCVNAVAPGYFPTRMTQPLLQHAQARIEAHTPLGRIGRPGELKGVVVFLASAASDYVTGQVLAVDGGRSAW
jgi:NAD(P)-dependent dehydrogenase (short-subunit alcohol dehydrogenase family)